MDKNHQFPQVLEVTAYSIERDKESEGKKTRYYYGNQLIAQENKDLGYVTYHYNNIGSTTELTDLKGKVIRSYSYGVYGEILGGDTTGILFLYNGQYGVITDSNSLYYMRARYYNPEIKRFINQDVVTGDISNSQSLNRYSYVQGNPISFIDPFGLSPYNIFSEVGHALLNVLGFIPGVGDVADIINGIWYLAEGRTAEGLSSFISALPFAGSIIGNGLKIGFKGSKGVVKAAMYIEKGASIIAGVSTLYRAGKGAGEGILRMYDKYVVQKQKIGKDTLGEVGAITLNIFAGVLAGKGLKSDISDVASLARVRNKGKANEPLMEMNLQMFAGESGGEIPSWRGSGPTSGVLGVNSNSKSIAAIENYNPKGGIEFVFDPITETFVVGKPKKGLFNGSPHEQLARSINADESVVLGGTFSRGIKGNILTTENSGHYGYRWTSENRQQFQRVMQDYGLPIIHEVWGW